MILASFVGIFTVPPLYALFQAVRERLRPGSRPKLKPQTEPPAAAPPDLAPVQPAKDEIPSAAE